MRSLIAVLLLGSLALTPGAKTLSQIANDKLSVDELREVEQFVRGFSRRLKQTRDLRPFLLEPTSREFLDKMLLDKDDSLTPVSQDLIRASNLPYLRKLWIAMVNLGYLSELYVYTRMSIAGLRTYELPRAQTYPPSVLRILERDPLVLKWWEQSQSGVSENPVQNIRQLRRLTTTLENAGTRMRVYFSARPPEQDPEYRNNLSHLSQYLKVFAVSTCFTPEDCAGLPLNTKSVTLNIPVLTLVLAWIDGRFKILVIGIIGD